MGETKKKQSWREGVFTPKAPLAAPLVQGRLEYIYMEQFLLSHGGVFSAFGDAPKCPCRNLRAVDLDLI